MYLAQRNVALKLNEVNFLNIIRGALRVESIADVIVVSCCVRWGRGKVYKGGNDDIANGSDERLLTKTTLNRHDVVLIKFPCISSSLDKSIN